MYDLIASTLVVILFTIKIVPSLQYSLAGGIWSIVYQALFGIWLIITFLSSGIWILKIRSKTFIALFFWIGYLLCLFIIYKGTTQLGFFSLYLSFWEPLIIYLYYRYYNKEKIMNNIAYISMIIFLLSLLRSYITLNSNELAARLVSGGGRSDGLIDVGNYSFTASITILIPSYLMFFKSAQIKFNKFISLLFIFLSTAFIFKANLMISIIGFIGCIYLLMVLDNRVINMKKVILTIIALIFLYLIYPYMYDILIEISSIISNNIDSSIIKERFDGLIQLLLYGEQVGTIESRIQLSMVSIKTFIENIFVGIGPQNDANLFFQTKLGLHSTFFDEFARYGLIGMSFIIAIFVFFYQEILIKWKNSLSFKYMYCGILVFILISFFNPVISANIGIVLFFILPANCEAYYKKSINISTSDDK